VERAIAVLVWLWMFSITVFGTGVGKALFAVEVAAGGLEADITQADSVAAMVMRAKRVNQNRLFIIRSPSYCKD
jgi:hypothetical protein